MDSNTFLPIIIFMTMVNAAITCGLSATLFLNTYSSVRNNTFLSFLSWCLLPMLWLGGLLGCELQVSFNEEDILVLANTLPFMLGLLVTFILYRKNIPSASS